MRGADLPHERDDGVDGAQQLEQVLPQMGALIATVEPADLRRSTPCDGWTMRDLLNHVIGGATMFADAFGGAPVHDISGRLPDVVGDDPTLAFETAVGRFGSAAQAPGAMERVLPLPWGSMTGRTFLRYAAFDLLIHTWDLATALERTTDLPDDLVTDVDEFARRVLGGWERDGVNFAAETTPSEASNRLQRLVAFTGRTPMAPVGSPAVGDHTFSR